MTDYPSTLPAPQAAEYSAQALMGLSAVTFEAGNRRQRRGARRERHVFNLTFIFSTAQLWTWQSWANIYGYDWHLMDLESPYSGLSATGDRLIPHYIRYTSDIGIEALGNGYHRATVTAELDLDRAPTGNIVPTGNWFVAGAPATPAVNTITAGTPSTPAVNTITSGTPAVPAA